jgi:ABC-type thiamine transport system ATPase subunit
MSMSLASLRKRLPVRLRQHWIPLTAGLAGIAVGLTIFGDVAIRPYSTSTAAVTDEERITENIEGTVDLFDDTVDHEVSLSYSQDDYDRMLDAYFKEGEKEWMTVDITIDGTSQLGIPPNRRPTSLVFQDYALFPHLRVRQNIGFGLRRQRLPKVEANRRIADVMELVGLGGLAERFPGELSGGQQQRVALARSLVLKPSIILMDEPLSNLDAKIRVSLRSQLKRIQSELNATILYVTHDQEEALSLGDQIANLTLKQAKALSDYLDDAYGIADTAP